MGQIHVYNLHQEDHTSEDNNWYIGRSKHGNPLGNPFTHNGKRSIKPNKIAPKPMAK